MGVIFHQHNYFRSHQPHHQSPLIIIKVFFL